VKSASFHNSLSCPRAVEGDEIILIRIKINTGGKSTGKLESLVAAVYKLYASCNGVKVSKNSVVKDSCKTRMSVLHGDSQCLSLVLSRKGSGETDSAVLQLLIQLGLAVDHLVGNKAQVKSGHSLFVHNGNSRLSVVADAVAGIFKGSGVHKGTHISLVYLGNKGIFVQSHKVGKILVISSLTVVDVCKMTAFQSCKSICNVLACKGKDSHFLGKGLVGIYLPLPVGVFLFDLFCGDKVHISNSFQKHFTHCIFQNKHTARTFILSQYHRISPRYNAR